MRKIVESTFVTLDGVISSPEKWGPPYWDEEHNAYAEKVVENADALLLGRVTYEGFAQAWPAMAGNPYADQLNAMPKYVPSTTITEGPWNGEIITGDVAASLREIKERPGGDIVKFGTGQLDRLLLAEGLVDELHLWVFPVVAGSGDRLLDGLDVSHFERLGTTEFASGITVLQLAPK